MSMKNKFKGKREIKILNIQRRINTALLIIFIILELIPIINFHNILNLKDSYITLKILGQGSKKVFNDNSPDEIYIYGNKKTTATNTYPLNSENITKLVWTRQLTSCYSMFESCEDIIEMNLTFFDTSHVTRMVYMFRNCHILISLELSNIGTSSISDMGVMFDNCYSLVSLDVSHFDTS